MATVTKTREETITPAKAQLWLQNNKSNRKVRKGKVEQFARDMQAGRWRVTNQAVGLNGDGSLFDGQHRLMAVIRAGIPVRMNVTRGLTRESMFGVDTGSNRTVADIAHVAGAPFNITNAMVSTARTMIDSIRENKRSESAAYTSEELIAFIVKHQEAISYACSLDLGKAGCAPFRAVAARAYYTVFRGSIDRFFGILGSGRDTEGDGEWPIRLREYFLSHLGRAGGGGFRRTLYARTVRAFDRFINEAPFTRLCESQVELYPLPEERETEAVASA